MPYTVYVLESLKSGRLYIGQTEDVERRLQDHNAGQTKSTRGRGPWRLLYRVPFETRSGAVRFERRLKAMKSPARVRALLDDR